MSEFADLLSMSSAALRAEPDRIGQLLRGVGQDWPTASPDDRERVVISVLDACAYSGPLSLRPGDVAKLLLPLLLLLPEKSDVEPYRLLLESIASRDGMSSSRFVLDALARRNVVPRREALLPLTPEAPEAPVSLPNTVDHELLSWSTGDLPRLGEVGDSATLSALSSSWRRLRASFDADRRFEIDHWMIRSAMLLRSPLELEYCDTLRIDSEFWTATSTANFAQALTAPFAAHIGELQAACLNSGLRFLRPRLFLLASDALVVSPISTRVEGEEVRDALFEELSYPFLRSIRALQTERARGPRPRVTVLDEIEEYLQDVLRRFGLRLLHQASDVVTFDPAMHVSLAAVAQGDQVVVVEPGLVEIANGRVRLTATVTVPTEASKNIGEVTDE